MTILKQVAFQKNNVKKNRNHLIKKINKQTKITFSTLDHSLDKQVIKKVNNLLNMNSHKGTKNNLKDMDQYYQLIKNLITNLKLQNKNF